MSDGHSWGLSMQPKRASPGCGGSSVLLSKVDIIAISPPASCVAHGCGNVTPRRVLCWGFADSGPSLGLVPGRKGGQVVDDSRQQLVYGQSFCLAHTGSPS